MYHVCHLDGSFFFLITVTLTSHQRDYSRTPRRRPSIAEHGSRSPRGVHLGPTSVSSHPHAVVVVVVVTVTLASPKNQRIFVAFPGRSSHSHAERAGGTGVSTEPG